MWKLRFLSSNDFHKFRYFSVHDSTVNAVLIALDVIDEEHPGWPPFAADIVLELWKSKNKGEYFVQVFYCGEVSVLELFD